MVKASVYSVGAQDSPDGKCDFRDRKDVIRMYRLSMGDQRVLTLKSVVALVTLVVKNVYVKL
jgi:hypothetical protein